MEKKIQVVFFCLFLMVCKLDNTFAHCSLCSSDIGACHERNERRSVSTHIMGHCHNEMKAITATYRPVRSYSRCGASESVTESDVDRYVI